MKIQRRRISKVVWETIVATRGIAYARDRCAEATKPHKWLYRLMTSRQRDRYHLMREMKSLGWIDVAKKTIQCVEWRRMTQTEADRLRSIDQALHQTR